MSRRKHDPFTISFDVQLAQAKADREALLKAVAPKPVPLGEFTAPEFTFEPVKGARAFDVDRLGRLRGVSYDSVWRPGENEAVCRANDVYDAGGAYQILSGYFIAGGGTPRRIAGTPKPPHSLVGCGCGFYGYYDGSNDYGEPARVSAVVEGYGEVVIGTRGFRATKARIVALTIEPEVPAPLAIRVRRNYQGIPVYGSFAEMVSAHPTDVERGVTPETDPDFWTRAV